MNLQTLSKSLFMLVNKQNILLFWLYLKKIKNLYVMYVFVKGYIILYLKTLCFASIKHVLVLWVLRLGSKRACVFDTFTNTGGREVEGVKE